MDREGFFRKLVSATGVVILATAVVAFLVAVIRKLEAMSLSVCLIGLAVLLAATALLHWRRKRSAARRLAKDGNAVPALSGTLGSLAGGIAHEINTPAQYVGDNLAFLKSGIESLLDVARAAQQLEGTLAATKLRAINLDYLAAELPAAADEALDGIARISRIVRAIKDFSLAGEPLPLPLDLNRAVELAAMATRDQWKRVAAMQLDLEPGLPLIQAVEKDINQVLVNTIINAVQAIAQARRDSAGRITITTRTEGDQVELSIADDGVGIPRSRHRQIFEMFFTTKPPGEGVGQGLAVADAIVRRHGGSVAVESEEGSGACFRIHLPVGSRRAPLLAVGGA
jgi:signal transduction histidine kinase